VVDAAKYSTFEQLRDGRRFEIRSLRPQDGPDLVAAIKSVSAQSLFRRFFAVRREFTEKEIAFFVNIDFVNHVALIAALDEANPRAIIGGGRYVVVKPGTAELAFAVVDSYQGQGVGTALMRHLTSIARDAGVRELIAEVLAENTAMLKIFGSCGLPMTTRGEADVVHVAIQLAK
jgi:GNAT superfamily N-acetyltransferase